MELTSSEKLCLHQLRHLLHEEQNLYVPKDDRFLIKYVRSRKCDPVASLKLLKNHYKFRKSYGSFFNDNLYPSRVRRYLDNDLPCWILKQRDNDGRKVVFMGDAMKWNPQETPLSEFILANLLIGEELFSEPDIQKKGVVIVFDRKGVGFQHFTATIGSAIKILPSFFGSFPYSVKCVHLVNSPDFSFFHLIRPFLSKKIQNRIIVHSKKNFEDFHEYIDPSKLPVRYGGALSLNDARDDDFLEKLYLKEKHYKRLLRYGYRA